MACDCLAEFNTRLEAHNTRICETFYAGVAAPSVTLKVEALKADGPAPCIAVPFFCPFCGERYQEPPAGRWNTAKPEASHVH